MNGGLMNFMEKLKGSRTYQSKIGVICNQLEKFFYSMMTETVTRYVTFSYLKFVIQIKIFPRNLKI